MSIKGPAAVDRDLGDFLGIIVDVDKYGLGML
jgi:hypothetical protein